MTSIDRYFEYIEAHQEYYIQKLAAAVAIPR
jgi:hypothetical protein